jgi:hypothetical protein
MTLVITPHDFDVTRGYVSYYQIGYSHAGKCSLLAREDLIAAERNQTGPEM